MGIDIIPILQPEINRVEVVEASFLNRDDKPSARITLVYGWTDDNGRFNGVKTKEVTLDEAQILAIIPNYTVFRDAMNEAIKKMLVKGV